MKKLKLIKIGGNSIGPSLEKIILKIKEDQNSNYVLVHGGGPQIDKLLNQLGISPLKIRGKRFTDEKVMQVVNMVLNAEISSQILLQFKSHNINSMNLNCINILEVELFNELGRVGNIKKVNTSSIELLIKNQIVPIISPVCAGKDLKLCNVNADDCASEIAAALNVDELIFITDVEGVKNKDKVIEKLDVQSAKDLINQEVITGGMIPKVEMAIECVKKGINKVLISSQLDKGTSISL